MLLHRGVGVGEDHALIGEVFLEAAVDHFGLVLGLDPGEVLFLGLGNPQPVVGLADVLGHVVPALLLAVRGTDVVEDVLEIEVIEVTAPARQRLGLEDLQRLEPKLPHPVGLVLDRRDLFDDLDVEPLAAGEDVVVGRVVEPVLVIADRDVGLGVSGHVGLS